MDYVLSLLKETKSFTEGKVFYMARSLPVENLYCHRMWRINYTVIAHGI